MDGADQPFVEAFGKGGSAGVVKAAAHAFAQFLSGLHRIGRGDKAGWATIALGQSIFNDLGDAISFAAARASRDKGDVGLHASAPHPVSAS
jgi:hypothetical protein